MQALTCCDAEFMSTRTTAGQFQGEFKGSMECYMRGFDLAPELTAYCHNTPQNSEHTSGAMDESSGKGSKMQAHISSGVVMDIAAFKVCHPVGGDKDATALQAKKWSA